MESEVILSAALLSFADGDRFYIDLQSSLFLALIFPCEPGFVGDKRKTSETLASGARKKAADVTAASRLNDWARSGSRFVPSASAVSHSACR
jgi:hypothetical protein